MKKFLIVTLTLLLMGGVSAQTTQPYGLTDGQIRELIEKNRPSEGGSIPADLSNRLGATHMDGQYCLTDEPFIIEGAKKVHELGYGVLKLWFAKADGNPKGYSYHSDWNLNKAMTFKDLAQHPYYRTVFAMPFQVFVLNINEGFAGASTSDQTETLKRIENEFYDLTKYLLTCYQERQVTFLLSMWEGDWTLRGGTGSHNPEARWKELGPSTDAPIRIKNMIAWVEARQRGVDRARNEIRNSKCQVYNVVEVNRVFDGMEGIPTVTTDVLPKVRVDMVSWSAYDGKSPDGVKMYKGIDFIRDHLNPTPAMHGEKVVFIGEINEKENVDNKTREEVRDFCDTIMGVYLAQKIPYIIYWELYGNEPKPPLPKGKQERNYTAQELCGNWLIRPDGTHSWAQEYFDWLLAKSRQQKNP